MSGKKVRGKKIMLYIWCRDEDTYRAFRRYAAGFRNYEEALRALLKVVGAIEEAPTF